MRIEKEKKEQEIIEIKDDVKVGEFILEKGDKIVILEAEDKDNDDDEEKDDDMNDDDDDDEDEKDEKSKKKECQNKFKKSIILKKMKEGKKLSSYEKKFIATYC